MMTPDITNSDYLARLVKEAVRDELMPLNDGALVGQRLHEFLANLRARYQLTLLDPQMANLHLWPALREGEQGEPELSIHLGNIADRLRFAIEIDGRLTWNAIVTGLEVSITEAYGLKLIEDTNRDRLPVRSVLSSLLNGNGWLVTLLLLDKYLPQVTLVVTQRQEADRPS